MIKIFQHKFITLSDNRMERVRGNYEIGIHETLKLQVTAMNLSIYICNVRMSIRT